MVAVFNFAGLLHPIVSHLIKKWMVKKATFGISNVPGPRKPLKFGDSKIKGIIGVLPSVCDLTFAISAISLGETIYMAVSGDSSVLENPKELRDLINENYKQLLQKVKA